MTLRLANIKGSLGAGTLRIANVTGTISAPSISRLRVANISGRSTGSSLRVAGIGGSLAYAPTFVTASQAKNDPTSQNTGTVTVPAPSGLVTGNTLIAAIYDARSSPGTQGYTTLAPAGWTLAFVQDGAAGSLLIFTKTVTASEPASYTFGWTLANGYVDGAWYIVGEILQYTPAAVSVSGTATLTPNTTSPTLPTVSAPAPGTLLGLWAGFDGAVISSVSGGLTVRQGFTEAGNMSLYAADAPITTAGTTTASVGTASSTDTWVVAALELVPAIVLAPFSVQTVDPLLPVTIVAQTNATATFTFSSPGITFTVSGNTATFSPPATVTGGTVSVTVTASANGAVATQTAVFIVNPATILMVNAAGTVTPISYPYYLR